jgi:hypothetical protein
MSLAMFFVGRAERCRYRVCFSMARLKAMFFAMTELKDARFGDYLR